MNDDGFGWKFWLWVIGVALAIGIGGMILFILIGAAWYSWGFFGALAFICIVALAFGWIYDKRHQRDAI
jgi:hypothetical protein